MKKVISLLTVLILILTLTACGNKDAVAGTWKADLGNDGIVTWNFDGTGNCTMKNSFTDQKGTYTIKDDQITVKLELWDNPSTYTFNVDESKLTMKENSGYGISGTFEKQ